MTNTKRIIKVRGTNPKSGKELLERVALLGLETTHRGGHIRILSADGHQIAVLAGTPTCSRALLNTVSDLRRAGVDVRAMTVR